MSVNREWIPEPELDSGGFERLSPADEINEQLGWDADVTDSRQYCKHGVFIGSWAGPDYMCGRCEMGED
jgi:hypothetical protein